MGIALLKMFVNILKNCHQKRQIEILALNNDTYQETKLKNCWIDNMTKEQMIEKLVELSVADDWEDGKKEWELYNVCQVQKPNREVCLCGHGFILNICVVRNYLNNETVRLGYTCCDKLFPTDAKKIFIRIDEIKRHIDRSANEYLVKLLCRRRVINDGEKCFYLRIRNKVKLTPDELDTKVKINEKILKKVLKNGEIK